MSFAYCYDTIEYFSKITGNEYTVWADDFKCEERSSESKESNEKSEKLNFSDDCYFNNNRFANNLIYDQTERSRFCSIHNKNSSSDYSQEVYFPPELI